MSDAAEKAFAASFAKALADEAFFQINGNGNLIRRDLSAATVAYFAALDGLSGAAFTEQTRKWIALTAENPRKQAIFSYFFCISDAEEVEAEGQAEWLRALQQEADAAGLITDFVLIRLRQKQYQLSHGRKIGDRKIRKILERLLAESGSDPVPEEGTFRISVPRKPNPTVKHYGLNPVFFLIFCNLLIYIGGLILAARCDADYFLAWGIQDNACIRDGEVWRLFTAMFLHADFAHVGGNMLMLYLLGRSLYPYCTKKEFDTVYFGAGLFGNLLGLFLAGPALSLGASGAIMGLGGALVYRMTIGENAAYFRRTGNFAALTVSILYNLLYGLFAEGIDNYAHFGGFLAGFLIAWAFGAYRRRRS